MYSMLPLLLFVCFCHEMSCPPTCLPSSALSHRELIMPYLLTAVCVVTKRVESDARRASACPPRLRAFQSRVSKVLVS